MKLPKIALRFILCVAGVAWHTSCTTFFDYTMHNVGLEMVADAEMEFERKSISAHKSIYFNVVNGGSSATYSDPVDRFHPLPLPEEVEVSWVLMDGQRIKKTVPIDKARARKRREIYIVFDGEKAWERPPEPQNQSALNP